MLSYARLKTVASQDGTQGYTPYGYGMDTPVRVAVTTSYGRGWQMLRSRGAGSNQTGPCDPPQQASSCSCSASSGTSGPMDGEDALPRCLPSTACGGAFDQTARETAGRATILVALDMNRSNLRFISRATCVAATAR